jgi:hypothetical protein
MRLGNGLLYFNVTKKIWFKYFGLIYY